MQTILIPKILMQHFCLEMAKLDSCWRADTSSMLLEESHIEIRGKRLIVNRVGCEEKNLPKSNWWKHKNTRSIGAKVDR